MIEPRADHAVKRHARARIRAAELAEDEFWRRQRRVVRADFPRLVVEIELRLDGDEVHIRLVIGVERAHVPPVTGVSGVLIVERKRPDAVRRNDRRDDVLPEIVVLSVIVASRQSWSNRKLELKT